MIAEALLPLFFYVLFGILLRTAGIVQPGLAQVLFRFIFVCTLPALIFSLIVEAPLGRESAMLTLTGLLTNLCCAAAAWSYGRYAGLDRRETGLLVLSASVSNMLFVYPFVDGILGEDGLRDAVLFDIGNALYVGTVASGLALHYGNDGSGVGPGRTLAALLRAPIFLALSAALLLNLSGTDVAPLVLDTTRPLGEATLPVTLVALGMSLSVSALSRDLPVAAIVLRMGLGLILGLSLTWLLGIDGVTRWVVVAGTSAPIGFGTVALVSVGRLDVDRAAAAVSVSVLIGLVTVTAILLGALHFADSG